MKHTLSLVALLTLLAPLCSAAPPQKAPVPLSERFEQIRRMARERHVTAPTDEVLYKGAIKGMLKALDPYSAYLDEQELSRLKRRLKGNYSGIGIEIGVRHGQLTVISPIEGGPAEAAGLLAGDRIVQIEGESTRGWTTRMASQRLLGREGTQVRLTVVTPGQKGSRRQVTITRARIVIKAAGVVVRERQGRRIAVARLRTFNRNASSVLGQKLSELKDIQGIVLDLRNNPGGLLSEAVAVSSLFLERGTVVTTVGPGGDLLRSLSVTEAVSGPEWARKPSTPLVVLINQGSASASEIVAGALQDHRRAVLVGQKSFGKGSVQTILTLSQGAALKLTTARYRLPGGRIIDGKGLFPDLTAGRRDRDTKADPAMDTADDVIRSWTQLRGVGGVLRNEPTPSM